ncbi:hypothetical protein STEG23_013520, partial [Scotinomys teguina]
MAGSESLKASPKKGTCKAIKVALELQQEIKDVGDIKDKDYHRQQVALAQEEVRVGLK